MSARLRDVELKLRRRSYLALAGTTVVFFVGVVPVLIVLGILFAVLGFSASMSGTLILLGTLGLTAWGWLVFRRNWTSDWESDLRSAASASNDLAACIRAAVETAPAGRPEFAAGLARFLASSGSELLRPGEAVRIASPCRPIEPLDVAIEPLTLDRRDPAFKALRGAKALSMPGWVALVIVITVPWFLVKLFASPPSYGLSMLVAAGGGILTAIPLLLYQHLLAARWFAVPGGLVRRWPLKKGVRLYPAGTCRLLVVSEGGAWTSIVVLPPDERPQRFRLGDIETEAQLAAWLSPLPPPTDEQLTELGA